MGQNQSYPDGTSTAVPGESDCGSSGNHMSGASETSDDATHRDGVDKRMVAVNQAQSVRAAIDTLIESCLVAKDDGMNGETVKAPAVGYSLEQLTNLKEDAGNGKKPGSADKKSSIKKEADSKASSKDRDDDLTPKTFGSLMEKSIIELIKKGDDELEELAMIGGQNQDEKPAEGSVKCDKKNSPGEQTKSAVGGGGSGDKTANSGKTNAQQQAAPVTQPKRTVRLQTLIDTVLDNSLAHDMPSIFEKRKNDALINDLMMGRSESASKNITPPKPSQTKTSKATTTTTTAAATTTTTAAGDMKENKMIFLMDHIEKVLERNFEASNEESDNDSNLQILNQLSWDSPPTSTSTPTQNTESPPRTKQSENQSRASSGSNCSEGTISVQDIVDRVISQTEVISKLLSPSDSAATSRAGKEAGKNSTASLGGGGGGSSNNQQQQQAVSQVGSKLTEQSRSPQSRPSSGSHLMEGHSSKMSERDSSRGRPRASTYDSHQMWNLRHAQEAGRSVMGRSLEKSSQEYRQLDVATSGGEGLHGMSKNNNGSKSVSNPGYGAGPLVLPPYMNSLAPTSGIISFAQSPVFRPPGHQMFVPRYPVPMLRVDMPSDGPQALPPHPPTANCACVACKFHMEEHSPKHGLLGPVSPSSSGGMLSPHHRQMDSSSYYQQRLASQLHPAGPGQHNPYMMRDYGRPSSNSPGRHPMPNAPQMPPVANNKQQQGVGQTQKTVHYPPSVPMGGLPRDSEFHGYTSYEKQKQEMLKVEPASYHAQHLPQISVQNPFETPRTDVYSGVDPSFLVGRLEPGLQRSEDFGRGSNYEHSVDKRLQSLPPRTSPAQAAMHDESRRERGHASSQILDLTVKNEARAHVERAPSRSEPVEESSDEPLDLSKKSSASGMFTSDQAKRLQQIHTPKTEPVGFRKPDPGIKLEVSSKPPPHHQPHVDGNARYSHPQPREVHPYPGVAAPSVFSMNSRVPGPAEMAPTVNPNMLISPGGQRPQLHPLPAPSLATSLMPSSSSSSAAMLQTYMAHATVAAAANHTLPPSAMDQRDKLTIPGQPRSKSSEPVLKPQRESPQLDLPDTNLEKGDIATRRNSTTGRNEPIQSIIGNHNPNDILYLICRICRQSNGSPYAFRKHFRNHHGFEPKAEHTIVQTISATKSARQNPYASNGPEADYGPEPGQSGAEEQSAVERTPSQPKEGQGSSSESFPLQSSPQNEVGNKSKNYGSRSAADGKQQGVVKDNRENTKYLECPECKQTFQLNDFGSYKRHCRQHNQSRTSSGSFIAPELSDPQDSVDKMQGGITMCKICGVPFSVHYIEDHVRSVHGYFCSQCPDVFKTSDDLQLHSRSAHLSSFLPTASPGIPAASPGIRLSPRIHSPSHASLPSNSPSLSNSPHHRSPSRTGGVLASTPSPGNVSQKANRNNMHSSPGDPPGSCVPSSKPGAVVAITPSRVSSAAAESTHNYGPISLTCEIERMPADNLTISASPDSSSDNVAKCSMSISDVTVSCSLTSSDTPEDRNKVVSSVKGSSNSSSKTKADDDMDSTVSGSPSSDMIIDLPAADGDVQNFFYKHKKFGGHRKRTESSDGSEVSAKAMKRRNDDSASGQNVNEDSSGSSCGSCKSTDGEKQQPDDRVLAKEQNNVVVQTKSKVDGRIKQEARHQLPFVWDRVTRIQAGKNIKPPDYMT
ncbi:uncharacterized protein LOC121385266 [Gigantopelta aegis]|uniref:uncharacterized protein LOC121385266 n=1 Tax=Gigantopelta aegis TaxID=1735272 RepID=UPI001B888A15|nr:uncharacterized protein LOC121385266 [Gigantopelta aegis]